MRTFIAILAASFAPAVSLAAERIVPLGGDITEIVFALGEGDHVACVDETARYPQAALSLPQVGYVRNLAAEGVLSCRPDLVIASHEAGPPAVLAQIKDARVPLAVVKADYSFAGVLAKIDQVSAALGQPAKGAELNAKLKTQMAAVQALLADVRVRPKALFILAHGPTGVQVGGANTPADAIIRMAGAQNVAGAFEGFKPFTPEAAAALAPDVIIVADFSAQAMGGLATLSKRPEILLTPAGRNGRIVVVDTMLMLGFGPRTSDGVMQLARALHPGLRQEGPVAGSAR